MRTKNYFAETIQLSTRLVRQYYRREVTSILPLLHSDVVWIGASGQQYLRGYDAVSKQLKRLSAAPPCGIRDVNLDLTVLDTSVCAVTGWYLAEANPGGGESPAAIQRCTLIWKMTDGCFQLIHMHISNPQTVPHQADLQTYEYRQRTHAEPLMLCGRNAETFFIHPEDIIYIEAVNINCIIHCLARSPLICMPMAHLAYLLPSYFVRIHRSYIVNPLRVTEIRRCYVILEHGGRLPIPEKKYREIKNLLKNYSHIG